MGTLHSVRFANGATETRMSISRRYSAVLVATCTEAAAATRAARRARLESTMRAAEAFRDLLLASEGLTWTQVRTHPPVLAGEMHNVMRSTRHLLARTDVDAAGDSICLSWHETSEAARDAVTDSYAEELRRDGYTLEVRTDIETAPVATRRHAHAAVLATAA